MGWEGVGVCSYWLVSFWFQQDSAASAGKKAFIYNRIGDVGFLLAIFLIFDKTGTLATSDRRHLRPAAPPRRRRRHRRGAPAVPGRRTGKSAQIPLFNWLPDAMEGPTPVSALIHAATMVTAGVYLLCRMNPLLHVSRDGRADHRRRSAAATAFVAATIACAQQDIKKVLAFSTVSQIGYMILAVGTGAYIAAIFLMVCPRLLQGPALPRRRLGHPRARRRAGPQAHGRPAPLHDVDHRHLHHRLALAIAGIPPLSGFWAKGDVLDNAFAHSKPLWVLGLVTAVLTAYYMSRLETSPSAASRRFDTGGRRTASRRCTQPHESPWVMRLPLVVLAFFAFFAGVLDLPWVHTDNLSSWLDPVFAGTSTTTTSARRRVGRWRSPTSRRRSSA